MDARAIRITDGKAEPAAHQGSRERSTGYKRPRMSHSIDSGKRRHSPGRVGRNCLNTFKNFGAPYRTRTGVFAVRGLCVSRSQLASANPRFESKAEKPKLKRSPSMSWSSISIARGLNSRRAHRASLRFSYASMWAAHGSHRRSPCSVTCWSGCCHRPSDRSRFSRK